MGHAHEGERLSGAVPHPTAESRLCACGAALSVTNPGMRCAACERNPVAPLDKSREGGTTLLKKLIRERYWSYSRFCKEYDKVAKTLDKDLVGTYPSPSTYKRWTSGKIDGLPRSQPCAVLGVMFPDYTVEQLFESLADGDKPHDPPDRTDEVSENVRFDSGLTIGRNSVTVGRPDVRTLIDAHQHYEQMYRRSGGLPTGARIESFLNEYGGPLLAGSYRDNVGREARRALAALIALAGICSYDCEHHGAAQRHFNHALQLAEASSDPRFGGYVFALKVNQALALGDFRQAVDHTESAIEYAGRHISPALMADLLAMQAKAYAQMGEHQLTYSTIAKVESLAARIRRHEEPVETSYVQPGLIEAKIGEALSSLDDLHPAYRYAEESLRVDDHLRGRVNRLASMSALELRGGDVERASSLAIEMVECAKGMESRRLHSRFRVLRVALNNHPANVTDEAVDRIDRTLRMFPW